MIAANAGSCEFDFRSRNRAPLSGPEWRAEWSSGFDTKRYPDEVYKELVARGSELSDADFELLGGWKDGAIRGGGQRQFGQCHVHFTGNWRPNAVCAYTVWLRLPQRRSQLEEFMSREDYRSFLDQVASEHFVKACNGGHKSVPFGLSRATYILHVFSKARFPIYDSNTHSGICLLTHGHYHGWGIPKTKSKDPDWYLERFCAIIGDLQQQCAANGGAFLREADKALFQFGKYGKRR
jgi:hypothetical protein